jgi:hypothetical protein
MNRYKVTLTIEVEVDAHSESQAYDKAVDYVETDMFFMRSDAAIKQIEQDEFYDDEED